MIHRDLIEWIGGHRVTHGPLRGEPFELAPFQRRFITGAFAPEVAVSALSIARSGGKTALAAMAAKAVIDPSSPLHEPRGEGLLVAGDLRQAEICFNDILASIVDTEPYRIVRAPGRQLIEHVASGAVLHVLSSSPERAHGRRPKLVIADEPAKWQRTRSLEMRAACESALGKVENSRMVCIGTRPPDREHWFDKMLTGSGADYGQIHDAPDSASPFRYRAWCQANPLLPRLPWLRAQIKREAERARVDPEARMMFEAYRLNRGVSDTIEDVLVTADEWRRVEARWPVAVGDDAPVFGVDLGGGRSACAVVACWQSGRVEGLCMFGGSPSLADRAARDAAGNWYELFRRSGELLLDEGRMVPRAGLLLRTAIEKWGNPSLLVADRWREGDLTDALSDAGLRCRVRHRGFGFKDGEVDIGLCLTALRDGKIAAAPGGLLRYSVSHLTVTRDHAGNRKVTRARQRALDDPGVALVLAVAEHERRSRMPPARPLRVLIA